MNFIRRFVAAFNTFGCCIALTLLCVAFGTKFWIVSTASRDVRISTTTTAGITSGVENFGPFVGRINFGLFEGFQELNKGMGPRAQNLAIVCLPKESICMWSDKDTLTANERLEQIKDEFHNVNEKLDNSGSKENFMNGFINFKLWLSTVVILSLAVIFTIVALGFSILNIITIPVGTLTGIIGLYLWNGLAATFTFGTVAVWAVLYHQEFRYNVMNSIDVRNQWISKDSATFGFSFWILVGAILIFIANSLFIFVSMMESKSEKRTKKVVNVKPGDGIIMLY